MTDPSVEFIAAPLDRYAERITSGIALLGGVLMLPALFLYLSGLLFSGVALPGLVISVAVAVTLGAWLLLNYAVQPTLYRIEADQLLIRRRWARPMPIPYRSMLGVSPAPALADVPRFGLRRSFNAGVFGYQGPFTLAPYGGVFFIATNRERLVAVARSNQLPLIISPARPREFVDALREALIRHAEDRVHPAEVEAKP
ncbi:MAG TPA: PH domain-containing protein [Roseiflexaceae bacterium]|nr:PH domain-containing protein [Roseiflexaceae bacterium]HMP41386.1 PH domain-containing protein [Roseiflexaceae bacterium]